MPGNTSIENGKRGGRPRGRRNKKTLEQELELSYIRERVAAAKKKLVDSQISLAQGVSYLYRVNKVTKKNGDVVEKKPVLVTSEYEIESYLAGDYDDEQNVYYYITTVKPENSALDSLFDRAVGRPKQVTELSGKDGGPIQIEGVEISVRKT